MWETIYGMALAYPLVCFIFVPVYLNLGITSVYQYLDMRWVKFDSNRITFININSSLIQTNEINKFCDTNTVWMRQMFSWKYFCLQIQIEIGPSPGIGYFYFSQHIHYGHHHVYTLRCFEYGGGHPIYSIIFGDDRPRHYIHYFWQSEERNYGRCYPRVRIVVFFTQLKKHNVSSWWIDFDLIRSSSRT